MSIACRMQKAVNFDKRARQERRALAKTSSAHTININAQHACTAQRHVAVQRAPTTYRETTTWRSTWHTTRSCVFLTAFEHIGEYYNQLFQTSINVRTKTSSPFFHPPHKSTHERATNARTTSFPSLGREQTPSSTRVESSLPLPPPLDTAARTHTFDKRPRGVREEKRKFEQRVSRPAFPSHTHTHPASLSVKSCRPSSTATRPDFAAPILTHNLTTHK